MKEKIEAVLNNEVRGILVADGGGVEVVDVTDGTVKVRLTGACAGCPMATMTLQRLIEGVLKKQVPEIKKVIAVQ